jgi:AraC family transcriptional regulator of adaptative response/methylated-DNA-[protein]-cysteine methyltransferase
MPHRPLRPLPRKTALHYAIGNCPLGRILAAHSLVGLCAVILGDEPEALPGELQARFPQAELIPVDPVGDEYLRRVISLIDAPQAAVEIALDIPGTAFQQRVWAALRQVPPGQTATYGEIARQIGAPGAARAVGAACAANPVTIVIPCHRAVGSNGNFTGYRWGIERKRALLEIEAGCREVSDCL